MKHSIFAIITLSLLPVCMGCKKNSPSEQGEKKDPSIVMQATINGKLFSGKKFISDAVPVSPPRGIEGRDSSYQTSLSLYPSQMEGNVEDSAYSLRETLTYVRKNRNWYNLLSSVPNEIVFSRFRDSTIAGNFYASFYNAALDDTVRATNGSFRFQYTGEGTKNLSCFFDDSLFTADIVQEDFPRRSLSIFSRGEKFRSGATSVLECNVRTLRKVLLGTFSFGSGEVSAELSFFPGEYPDSVLRYVSLSGTLNITDIDSIAHRDSAGIVYWNEPRISRATFSFLGKRTDANDTINVTNGKYSVTGF